MQIMRKQMMEEIQHLNLNWPHIAHSLQAIMKQELYREWGFQSFAEYLTQELRMRNQTMSEIMDSANFFERHFPEEYKIWTDTSLPISSAPLPHFADVAVLVKNENHLSSLHPIGFEQIVRQVFACSLKGKDIKARIDELPTTAAPAVVAGSQDNSHDAAAPTSPSSNANTPTLPAPNANTPTSQMPSSDAMSNLSQSKMMARRTLWDNVAESRAKKMAAQSNRTAPFAPDNSASLSGELAASVSSFSSSDALDANSSSDPLSSGASSFAVTKNASSGKTTITEAPVPKTIADPFPSTPLPDPGDVKADKNHALPSSINPMIPHLPSPLPTQSQQMSLISYKQWKKIKRWVRDLSRGVPLGIIVGIIGALILVYAVLYIKEKKQQRQNERQYKEYIDQAKNFEQLQQWDKAIAMYQHGKPYADSTQNQEINQKISSIESLMRQLQNARTDFQDLCKKAQQAEDLQDYYEAASSYSQALELYQKETKLLSLDSTFEEMAKNLPQKIASNQNNYKAVMNKTKHFRAAYQAAEQAAKEGKYKEALLAYQQVYSIDKTYNEQLENKIKEMEKKCKAIEAANFERLQREQGKILYNGHWVTPKEKLELEGFREYQNRWVSPELYKLLREEEERCKEQIELLTKLIEQQQAAASKTYVLETSERKKYRGEILSRNQQSVTMKLIFNRGSIERTFSSQEIVALEIENPIWDEYSRNFAKKRAMYDLLAMLKWAQNHKLQEVIQLARYRLFLLDFTHPDYQRIPVIEKDGIWYPLE